MPLYRLGIIVLAHWVGVLVMAQTTVDLGLPRNSGLSIPPNQKKIFTALGSGFQRYKCTASGASLAWTNIGACQHICSMICENSSGS